MTTPRLLNEKEIKKIVKIENKLPQNEFNETKLFFNELNKLNNTKIKSENLLDTRKNFNLPKLDLNATKNSFHKNLDQIISNRDTSRIKADLNVHNELH